MIAEISNGKKHMRDFILRERIREKLQLHDLLENNWPSRQEARDGQRRLDEYGDQIQAYLDVDPPAHAQ